MLNTLKKLQTLLKKLESVDPDQIETDMQKIMTAASEDNEAAKKELEKLQADFSILSKNLLNLADFIDRKFD